MSDLQVTTEYISVGANRQTAGADWSGQGTFAFAADVNVGIWKPSSFSQTGVSVLLKGHTKPVKAIQFLPCNSEETNGSRNQYLLSGSDDKSLRLWELPELPSSYPRCIQTIDSHTGPVNCITTSRCAKNTDRILIATGGADATMKIWTWAKDPNTTHPSLTLLQSLTPKQRFYPLALAISQFDPTDINSPFILAATGTTHMIHLYVSTPPSSSSDSPFEIEFQHQTTLAGHEGWVRSLSFTQENPGSKDSDLLLASASQDKYIRLWRVNRGADVPAQVAAAETDGTRFTLLPSRSPSNKIYWLKTSDTQYSVTFEALLLGHEDWIYSAKWYSPDQGKPRLLSTSADNSVAIWEADPSSSIWLSTVRLGEISREKGATTATGSTGGFWNGLWGPDGKSLVCLSRTGSWRQWVYVSEKDLWEPRVAISGHTRSVTGISWSKAGSYLISVSSDQTTRLHAPWSIDNQVIRDECTWHEMARPQIHGYDLNCVDTLGEIAFVSGADEKLMRVFHEPKAVAQLLKRLSNIDEAHTENMPDAANMPVLGLSNKAVLDGDDGSAIGQSEASELGESVKDDQADITAAHVRTTALECHHPPLEETLSRHTLWPETEKLYGHGYELSCLAVSHDGTLVASACRASSINHAVIRLFDTKSWTAIKPPLVAHSLTVTRIRFSHDDRYLLSVGRDRQWALFRRDTSTNTYTKYESNLKGHSRMILDATWAKISTQNEHQKMYMFATAGRDKKVHIWSFSEGTAPSDDMPLVTRVGSLSFEHPVTSIDFLPSGISSTFSEDTCRYLLAVGTESGTLAICETRIDSTGAIQVGDTNNLDPSLHFASVIEQIAWRPSHKPAGDNYEFAVAGADSSLRIMKVKINGTSTQE